MSSQAIPPVSSSEETEARHGHDELVAANVARYQQDDLLWRQLKTIPAFRAILRAVESRFYYSVPLPEPVLDVGCGDGHFSQMTFDRPLTAGIDPW